MSITFAVSTIFKSKDEVSKNFNRMGKNAKKFGENSSRAFKKAGKSVTTFGDITKGILSANVITSAFRALGTGISAVTEEFVSFDAAITASSAKFKGLDLTTKEGQKTLEALKKSARDVGAVTKFSATEAAQGLDFYATAGFNAAQAMAVLRPTAKLATVANLDLARTSDIASDSLGIFGLQTEDSVQLQKNFTRISDVMAKTMTSTNTNMEDMFEAMKKGGAAFTGAGQDIETFNALMGTMANAGLKGAESGTQLRNIMLRLAKPTGEAGNLIEEMGIKVADSKGDFRNIIDIIGDFEKATSKMGDVQKAAALKVIFGVRSVTGLSALFKAGTENIKKFETQLRSSGGETERMANIMEQSLENKLLSMKSAAIELGFSFITAFEDQGAGAIDFLTQVIRAINIQPFVDMIKTGVGIVSDMSAKFQEIGERTGAFDSIGESMKAIVPLIKTAFDVVKTFWGFLEDVGIFDALGLAINVLGKVFVGWGEILKTVWAFVKPIIEGLGFAIKIVRGAATLFSTEEEETRNKSANDIIAEQRRKNLAAIQGRQAPNQTQLESRQSVNFNGRLDIANAPEGSTFTQGGTGAPPIDVNMLGFSDRGL